MRIALVSPYSWTYPGGVTRHIEALAERYIEEGHHVRVLAPFDPAGPVRDGPAPRRRARSTSRRPTTWSRWAGPSASRPTGPSRTSRSPRTAWPRCSASCAPADYDVVHIHEPLAPLTGWVAADSTRAAARRHLPRLLREQDVQRDREPDRRPPDAQPPPRPDRGVRGRGLEGRRFFGGHYRVIPNGVTVDPERAAIAALRPMGDRLRIVFVGQAVERKGLPLLLRAFEALREHIPTELTVIGPSPRGARAAAARPDRRAVLGKVDDEAKRDELEAADVLCAPSLGGESFGMVLTEAFAAGTPVVASNIAGYRDVVRDGVDGVLVPPADPQALAEALRDLYEEPARRAEMARDAAADVQRFAWPRVAAEVMGAYEDAIATPAARRARCSAPPSGSASAQPTSSPTRRARRLPSLEPKTPAGKRAGAVAIAAPRGRSRWSRSAAPCSRCWRCRRSAWTASPPRCSRSSPTFVLLGLGGDVRVDGPARVLLVRDPACRAAARAGEVVRRRSGNVHRRPDVIDIAGPARRARACPGSCPADRATAGEPAGGAGHAGLPDAAQHRRSGDPRRDHVLLGRPVQRPPERAPVRGDRAGGAAGAGAALAGDPARRRLALGRGCTRCWTRRGTGWPACAPA